MKYHILTYFLASVVSLLISFYSLNKKSVSLSGFAAMLIISQTVIWLDRIGLLLVLFYMFASSSALSGLKRKFKKETEDVVARSGPRDYIQALANLGVGTLCILAHCLLQNQFWLVALAGSVAAGNADSWASEIGVLSRKPPVSVLNFRPLPAGISGGITALGTLAGLAGSVFIALGSFFTIQYFQSPDFNIIPFVFSVSLAGFIGMLLDSFAGAFWQALYSDRFTGFLTENPGKNKLIKGISWINNDFVNLLCTLSGGAVAVFLYELMID